MKKILCLLLCIVCVFAFFGCDEEVSTNESESEPAPTSETVIEENITIDNNEEFAALMNSYPCDYNLAASFAKKYEGKNIEFDCYIFYMDQYKDYDTRFAICVFGGDFVDDPAHTQHGDVPGPEFDMIDVSYYDLNTTVDSIKQEDNLHLVATIIGYNEDNLTIQIDPVSTVKR